MRTKIAVEKTYWVGMTDDQRVELTTAVVSIGEIASVNDGLLTLEAIEVLSDLRQALLSV